MLDTIATVIRHAVGEAVAMGVVEVGDAVVGIVVDTVVDTASVVTGAPAAVDTVWDIVAVDTGAPVLDTVVGMVGDTVQAAYMRQAVGAVSTSAVSAPI